MEWPNEDSEIEEIDSDESLDISMDTDDETSNFVCSEEPVKPVTSRLHEFIELMKQSREKKEQNQDDTDVTENTGSEANVAEIMSEESDDYDGADSLDAFDREEIEKMLDEGINVDQLKSDSSSNPNIRTREALEKLKTNHFEMLPHGWIELTHHTGIPSYLHRPTRIVSLVRPYHLGDQEFRNHKVPMSTIPCLAYRKQLEELAEKEKNKVRIREDDIESAILTSGTVESVDENTVNNALNPEEIFNYCKKRFPVRKVYVKRKSERTSTKKSSQAPSLPPGSILISIPVYDSKTETIKTRDWPLNPNGKTPVCVLHEYLQQALKKGPTYTYKEIPNSDTPYQATLRINDMVYGLGLATSKRQAKLEAARATLEIIIPKLKNFDFHTGTSNSEGSSQGKDKYSIFDMLKITDPRVAECCAKSTEPSPYTMLLTCLERNYGIGEEMQVSYKSFHTKHNKIEFSMTVGKYKASVECKNKKEGKQLASQKILQELHPTIEYWGSLLRLYGNASTNNARKKKVREQEITRLQSKALVNQPNWDILNKLGEELLRKAAEKKEKLLSKGSFQVPENIELPSSSICDANLKG